MDAAGDTMKKIKIVPKLGRKEGGKHKNNRAKITKPAEESPSAGPKTTTQDAAHPTQKTDKERTQTKKREETLPDKAVKPAKKGSLSNKGTVRKSLTDAEYEEIFSSVIGRDKHSDTDHGGEERTTDVDNHDKVSSVIYGEMHSGGVHKKKAHCEDSDSEQCEETGKGDGDARSDGTHKKHCENTDTEHDKTDSCKNEIGVHTQDNNSVVEKEKDVGSSISGKKKKDMDSDTATKKHKKADSNTGKKKGKDKDNDTGKKKGKNTGSSCGKKKSKDTDDCVSPGNHDTIEENISPQKKDRTGQTPPSLVNSQEEITAQGDCPTKDKQSPNVSTLDLEGDGDGGNSTAVRCKSMTATEGELKEENKLEQESKTSTELDLEKDTVNVDVAEINGKSDTERQNKSEISASKATDSESETEMDKDTDNAAEEEEDMLSEHSFGSSLLDMAQGIDQWDRPEETRQRNEHTPCSTEGKVRSRPTTPNLQHKHHKHKHGKKQLAPRKLCFDGSGIKKKQKQKPDPSPVCQSEREEEEVPAEQGTWVQCDEASCKKWRYLPDVCDPGLLPERWTCSMNTDSEYNSCDKTQQQYDESDHIFTQYTLGSVVWAKLDGFPWWPAVVDTDPDYDIYCELPHENSMTPTDYHVVFLDDKVTRSWVRKTRIRQLTMDHLTPTSSYVKGHKFKKEMATAVTRAQIALSLSLQERLDRFGFAACFRKMDTKHAKAIEKKKQDWQKPRQKQQKEGPAGMRQKTKKSDNTPGHLKTKKSKHVLTDSSTGSKCRRGGRAVDDTSDDTSDEESCSEYEKQMPARESPDSTFCNKSDDSSSDESCSENEIKKTKPTKNKGWPDAKSLTSSHKVSSVNKKAVNSSVKKKKLFKSEFAKKRDRRLTEREQTQESEEPATEATRKQEKHSTGETITPHFSGKVKAAWKGTVEKGKKKKGNNTYTQDPPSKKIKQSDHTSVNETNRSTNTKTQDSPGANRDPNGYKVPLTEKKGTESEKQEATAKRKHAEDKDVSVKKKTDTTVDTHEPVTKKPKQDKPEFNKQKRRDTEKNEPPLKKSKPTLNKKGAEKSKKVAPTDSYKAPVKASMEAKAKAVPKKKTDTGEDEPPVKKTKDASTDEDTDTQRHPERMTKDSHSDKRSHSQPPKPEGLNPGDKKLKKAKQQKFVAPAKLQPEKQTHTIAPATKLSTQNNEKQEIIGKDPPKAEYSSKDVTAVTKSKYEITEQKLSMEANSSSDNQAEIENNFEQYQVVGASNEEPEITEQKHSMEANSSSDNHTEVANNLEQLQTAQDKTKQKKSLYMDKTELTENTPHKPPACAESLSSLVWSKKDHPSSDPWLSTGEDTSLSPPLSPNNRDQFVPSADNSDSDDDLLPLTNTHKKTVQGKDMREKTGGTTSPLLDREEDGGSDCLDLEDLPAFPILDMDSDHEDHHHSLEMVED